MKKMFITTPIYYASGKPHIGHAYTTILADVISRYKKTIGYNVFFLTGMDEHGQKIVETATKQNVDVQTMLDSVAKDFKKLWKDLDIDYSNFIRTTNEQHEKAVQEIFSKLIQNNYVYEGKWTGLYCVSCEENYTKEQAIKKGNRLYCKVGHELIEKNEPSYFLKVSEFSDWIKEKISTPNFIMPQSRVNELKGSFIDKGLEDLSVTRTSLQWGIPVKENKQHIIYVWIDALLSYLTGLGYLTDKTDNYSEFWKDEQCQVVHLMSKEITRFHCIYWPILLKMLKLRLPTHIISHGWVVTKEGKMSKSLGNVINPYDYINAYGSDAFRYFIVRQVSLEKDGIFSKDLFIETINSELANNYGNMATRIAGMIKKYFENVVPNYNEKALSQLDKDVITKERQLLGRYEDRIEHFAINELLDDIQKQYDVLNKYIDETKPWVLAKDPAKKDQLANCLNIVFSGTVNLAILLKPILVRTSQIIETGFNLPLNMKNLCQNWQGHKIKELPPPFIRIAKD
ncbi:MAG: methionine--tRNA ligase [Mycoplasmoidaceae bacterium]